MYLFHNNLRKEQLRIRVVKPRASKKDTLYPTGEAKEKLNVLLCTSRSGSNIPPEIAPEEYY